MERTGHELLARAGLAGDERRPDVGRETPNHAKKLLHERPASNHPAELEALGDVAFNRKDAAPALDLFANRCQELLEPREVERLAQVIHRAELDRFNGRVDGRIAGHQHGLAAGIDLVNGANDVEAADVGHPQIDHRDVRVARPQLRDRLVPARARDHFESGTPREPADDVENALFVVHDE